MKKYSIYTILLLFIVSMNSCLFTEDEVFDDPAAQRLNQAISAAEIALSAGANGWVMEYFPTNATEGYTFLMMFNSDGKADVASKNKYTPNYTLNSGVWEVIGDNGPVLTFNTFINNFHLFSDPRNPGQAAYNGVGLAGDYEFIILNVEDDLIRLKGKKRGTDITLTRLESGQEWEDYFSVLDKMDGALFNKASLMTWTLKFNDKTYSLKNGASHIFTATPIGEGVEEPEDDEVETDISIPFIVTEYGIRLAQPLEVNGEMVQSFAVSSDNTSLYAMEENQTAIITGEDLFSFFMSEDNWLAGTSWRIYPNDVNGTFKKVYDEVVANCKSKYKEDFDYFYFKHKQERKGKTISFRSGNKYDGAFDFDITGVSDQISFSDKGAMDRNGEIYYTNIGGVKEILELFAASDYTISTGTPLCPSKIKFTSVKDSNNWFIATIN